MISVTFMGLSVSAYRDDKYSYGISLKETRKYTGDLYASVSRVTTTFPRSFDCYVENKTEFENLAKKIGEFGTLIIEGVSFSNCYISDMSDIFEIVRYSGKYTFHIQFSQAATDAPADQIYANEETLVLYEDYPLPAGLSLDYPEPILLRGLAYANISVENTGLSDNFTVVCYGSYNNVCSIPIPVFSCNLNTVTNHRGSSLSDPNNYLFVHIQNDDTVHDTTFTIIISKVATS